MSDTTRLVTAEDLERMPDDDWRYELVRGRLVRMSPAAARHGVVAMAIGALLHAHVKARNLGYVGPEIGFKLESDPDTVRAPDMAFIRRDRVPARDAGGFHKGPPDLAVEVLSPDDRPSEIAEKVEEYLTCGTRAVVVIDPDERTVVVHRRLTPPLTLTADDTLDLDDVVAEFRCAVREIFE